MVDRIAVLDGLAAGVDRGLAVDLLWFHLGQQAWFTLVGDRGWSFDRAEVRLAAAARSALLRDPGEPALRALASADAVTDEPGGARQRT